MDADNNSHSCKIGDVGQNGILKENHGLEPEVVIEEINGIRSGIMVGVGPDASSETIGESNGDRMVEPSTQDVEGTSGVNAGNNGSPTSEKVETKEIKEPKTQKIHGKTIEKPLNIKNATRASVKKTSYTAETKGTSNGTLAANARPKHPIMKNKSFNDRHATNSDPSKGTKLTPAASNTRKDKLPKSEITSSSGDLVQSEGSVEKSTLKPSSKGSITETEGDNESVGSGKSHKLGKLPAYDFSFRCHERAEKRKEFYTKLEQRVHAQEIEKNNQQAKSKESQEAEIKMLRKSLTFKATPMPTFSPLPKVELKKIPITRPKSPKLGRKKNSSSMEGDGDRSPRPARLSLDEKVTSQHKPGQGPGPTQSKQPQRKSLPRMPSQNTRLSKSSSNIGRTSQLQDDVINGNSHVTHIEEAVHLTNSESVPIARLNDEEVQTHVQVADMVFVPIARVEEESPISDPIEAHDATESESSVVDGSHAMQGQGLVMIGN